MLRVAWIFARVRWRMLYNGLAKSKKRDGLERVSRITKVAMPARFSRSMIAASSR